MIEGIISSGEKLIVYRIKIGKQLMVSLGISEIQIRYNKKAFKFGKKF